MEKDKKYVVADFIAMIKNSWTYQKMTEKEQTNLIDLLYQNRTVESLKGTYDVRWGILNSIYNAYLIGIGYDDFNWRSDKDGKN